MQLREAVLTARTATIDSSAKMALVCSFEPLHLTTYMQALLARARPEATPEVVTFGYDQLTDALRETMTTLARFPALLVLSWEDLHPALSWRSRGALAPVADVAIEDGRRSLAGRLREWVRARGAGESYVMIAPANWIPLLDPAPPMAYGETATAALAAMQDIASAVTILGARVLRTPPLDLNMRDLLSSGCPLTPSGSEALAQAFVAATIRGTERKKVLVTDLDGTLWKGIIGEVGHEGIQHRAEGMGHAYHLYQKFLKKLASEGVLLAFCSKNNEADVVPIFDALEMTLRLDDFAAYRCNWETKSQNIRSIVEEFNVGIDTVVFVDDNPAELAEVRAQLPAVTVFDVPQTGDDWLRLFHDLQQLFYTWGVSVEDRERTVSFSRARARRAFAETSATASVPGDATDLRHLRHFELRLTLDTDAFPAPRSLELINKTNQFNLSGERIAVADWIEMSQRPTAFCWSGRLEDRFGDFGAIAVVVGDRRPHGELFVRQFVLSCRAFARGVEQTILTALVRRFSCRVVRGVFRETAQNRPVHRFLTGLGARFLSSGEWVLDADAVREAGDAVARDTGIVVVER